MTGATETHSDTRGKIRRVQYQKEQRGSQLSAGYGATLEGGRTAGVRWRTGGAKSDMCGVTRKFRYVTHPSSGGQSQQPARRVLQRAGSAVRADYGARGGISRRTHERSRMAALWRPCRADLPGRRHVRYRETTDGAAEMP